MRSRDMAIGALFAVVAAVTAWLVMPEGEGPREAVERAPGPLARPHANANLACGSCHKADAPAKTACVGCHAAHPSTRPAHKALAAKGELGCVSCHKAHGDAQGVTFLADGAFVRWGAGVEQSGRTSLHAREGATVALVPIRACARCHDASKTSDPIRACTAGSGDAASLALCLDEHQRADVDLPLSTTSVCAKQHTEDRFVAWDAARDAMRQIPTLTPVPRDRRAPWTWLGAAALAACLGYAASALTRRLRKPPRVAAPTPAIAALTPAARVRLPQINTATCLGCYACVDACPFDVLEIERYVAVVARPGDCCGVALCEQVCPNGSLRTTEGESIEERPRVDEHLESLDAPGVFLAGDLTGLPLIKNAIAQGKRAIDRVAATLPKKERVAAGEDTVDVVIVGAGPAGLSAALRAKELGLSYVVVEQGTFAASISSFPRNKLVFDQPLDIPVEGALWLRESTKEELLAQWSRIVRVHKLAIREHHRVVGVTKEGPRFVVTTAADDGDGRVAGTRLVLAIGRRGSPRPLECHVSAGAESKVSYALADARTFAGQNVLIVGLGDSAMEAACAIARQPGAHVTMSYRGSGFSRGKARNIAEVKSLVAKQRLRLVFESEVERVDATAVMLRAKSGREELPIDAVIALIGGVPSWELVEGAGVKRTVAAKP